MTTRTSRRVSAPGAPRGEATEVTAAPERRVLLVRVGRERFAIPIGEVIEAFESPAVVPLALTPAGVLGQCTHRDRLVPVLDGGAMLGVPRDEADGVLLLLETDAGRAALRVDDVVDMVTVDPSRRRALPATGGAMTAMLEDVIDLDGTIAGSVAMDALRAAIAARLSTEVA